MIVQYFHPFKYFKNDHPIFLIGCIIFITGAVFESYGQGKRIPCYSVYEIKLHAQKDYKNPYLSVNAYATFTDPNDTSKVIPLFWNGGRKWEVRFSPAAVGEWQWAIHSSDPRLDGKSGRFRVVASNRHGGIQPMPRFPHHFEYQDGTPFWWMGDTNWALFFSNAKENLDRDAVEHYIDVRARQGFNVIHAKLISTEAGWGNGGGKPFDDLAAQRINPGYWQEVDRRVIYLNRHGITAGLVLDWGDKDEKPTSWNYFPSQKARERYARYVVARYSAYNIYFIVSGEWNSRGSGPKIRKMFNDIGRTIAKADPYNRMIAIHPYGHNSVISFADEPWMSFGDYGQIYSHLHPHILKAYHHTSKPVIDAEYAYYLRDRDGDGVVDKPNSASLKSIRYATWDIVMAGGYFITGFGTTYFGGYRDPGPFNVDASKNNPWERDVQYIKKLFTSLQWWKLKPADYLIQDHAEQTGIQWALAETGRQYVFYIRGTAHSITLSLGKLSYRKKWRLRQFNPRTGEFSLLKPYSGNGPITYSPPSGDDWILVVTVAPDH